MNYTKINTDGSIPKTGVRACEPDKNVGDRRGRRVCPWDCPWLVSQVDTNESLKLEQLLYMEMKEEKVEEGKKKRRVD